MKIGLVGYEANIKNRVGSNQYVFELLWSLWEEDKENEYVIFLPSSPLSDLPPPKENWRYKIGGPTRLWNLLGLSKLLLKEKPKPNVIFIPGHYVPIFLPSSLVISIMDLGYLRFPYHFTKPIYWKLKYWTEFSLKRASHILAISQSTKKDIVNFYKIPPEKITVAYPGVSKNFPQTVSDSKIKKIKEKYKIKNRYILFLSTLKPSKNIEGLLEAFKIFKNLKKEKTINLVITGRKGWLFEKIFKKVQELRLEKEVIFTDFVKEEEIPFLMKGAEVFVLPSFWEGFGIPVLEAMSLGVPVVASNVGSLPEVVNKAGILVNPYKPEEITYGIIKALENKEKLIKLGYQQVKKFDWQKTAQKIIKVLERVGGKNV
ncbi:MAG: glycosyltransferase family 4 protein [Microgenomates group bacterium]